MNSNTLEFFVKMRDMMSGGLAKMALNAQKSFGSVQKQVDNVNSHTKLLGQSYDELKRKIQQTEQAISSSRIPSHIREAKRELKDLQRMADNHAGNVNAGKGGFGGTIGKAAGMLGGILGVGAGIGFARSSVDAAMQFGVQQKTYEVLTGNKSRGQQLSQELFGLKQNTIMGASVYKNAQTMLGFGINDKDVIGNLKMLGDISMGDADRLELLTLAFSQTHAAGRLMGQDLLQYINAGFNPLYDISVMTGKSMGVLKNEMEKGAISSKMVEDAFKHATSAGGKFNGMMNEIAQTSYGKMKMLEGHWAAFKIDVGNALMPIADELMTTAQKTLELLNISQSVPAKLMADQASIDTLVGSITSLNKGNQLRGQLIQQLVSKYPEFFSKTDVEKTTNEELLKAVVAVNNAYKDRIAMASSDLMLDTNKKLLADSQSELTRNNTIIMALKQGNFKAANAIMKPTERIGSWFSDVFSTDKIPAFFGTQALDAKNGMNAANGFINSNEALNKQMHIVNDLKNTFRAAYALANDKDALSSTFKNAADKKKFLALAGQIMVDKNGMFHTPGGVAFASQLNAIMNPSATAAGGAGATGGISATGIGRAAASGGPRIININGVKFADKIEIHGENMQDAYSKSETKMQEMYLRILNSGASIQNN